MRTDKDRTSIGVGVIGTGKHGSRYANHIFRDIEGLHLAAICRRSKEGRLQARDWGCTWYKDWSGLITDPEVDCIVAAVPPIFNLPIARVCADAGKALLLEKPLAASGREAKEIIDLFAASDLQLTTGHTLRYNGVITCFRRLLPGIGHLHSFSANQRLEPSSLEWHEDPELAGAGVSFHTAVHIFDAIRYITGLEIVRVCALARKKHNRGLEDLVGVLLEMENDVVGTIDCSKVSQSRSGRYEFVGDHGQLLGDQVHNYCEQIIDHKRAVIDPGDPIPTIEPLLRDWEGYLRGTLPNPVSGEDGYTAVRICEACLSSSATGKWQVV